ncbi:hypothetical protein [Dysosmobacter sp.]|uniref:hypothetical protein n=1 Tax=Dysosmobacter sp. TaxID=2591382 RepID=UPI003A8D9DB4
MERLTEWNKSSYKHAYYPRCFEEPCYGNGCKIKDCPFETAVCERLASYEDSGLTPEELKAPFTEDAMINLAAQALGVEPSRLRELAEADKDGRVVVPPCKVGDVVYGFHGEKTILPMVAKWIETNTDGWCIAVQYTPMPPRFYRFSDFGKTVFLTREEAEKALQEMEGK